MSNIFDGIESNLVVGEIVPKEKLSASEVMHAMKDNHENDFSVHDKFIFIWAT